MIVLYILICRKLLRACVCVEGGGRSGYMRGKYFQWPRPDFTGRKTYQIHYCAQFIIVNSLQELPSHFYNALL